MADQVIEVLTSHEAPPKPVQELLMQMCAEDDEDDVVHIPERYLNRSPIHDVKNPVVDDGSIPFMEADAIDLSLLSSQTLDELAKLRSLLSSWGCFQLVNHGMSSSVLDEVRRASKQFFALSQEEKNKYARHVDDINGYGNDNSYGHNATVDWNDRLELLVHPEYGYTRAIQFCPDFLREIVDEFTKKSKGIAAVLLRAMALSLDLEEESFADIYGEDESMMLVRLNYFPPCPKPDLVLGARTHSDSTALAILLLDDQVEGLQVQKDGQWFKAPTNPLSLFIIAGDQMEMMSNGLFKGSLHRVTTNAERGRISFVMFCAPAADNEIKPPPKLITKERPQLYKTVKNYPKLFFQIDPGSDIRALDLIRINNA